MQNENVLGQFKKIGEIENEAQILRSEKISNFENIETKTRYYAIMENTGKLFTLKRYIDEIIEEQEDEAKLNKVLNIVENDLHNQLENINSNNLKFCKNVENEEEKKISKIYQAKINGKDYYMYKDKEQKIWKFCDDKYFEDVESPIVLSNMVDLYSKLGIVDIKDEENIKFVHSAKLNFAFGEFDELDNKVHFSMFRNVVCKPKAPENTEIKFDFTR